MISILLALALAAAPDLRVLPRPLALDFAVGDIAAKPTTQATLITAAAVLLVLELVIVRERASGNVVPTISQVMQEWGARYGTVAWTGGVLAGHWWWNAREWRDERRAHRDAMFLSALTLGVLAWDIGDHSGRSRSRAPVLLIGGVLAGRYLWPQKHRGVPP